MTMPRVVRLRQLSAGASSGFSGCFWGSRAYPGIRGFRVAGTSFFFFGVGGGGGGGGGGAGCLRLWGEGLVGFRGGASG